MTNFDDFHNRVSKRLISASFAIVMLLDFMPFHADTFFWLPEFSAMMLLYWVINRPQSVGIGIAFIIGLLVDIGTAAPLGQHALSYMLITFLIQQQQRQIILYSSGFQALAVLVALLGNQIILMLVRLMYDHRYNDWLSFIAPFVGALLWPLLSKIMLTILNSRRLR
ncbi:rod shape-determining protein MreD [Neisseria arctica]|uniref:Rod shape-determining protein MreD n=1 Tax=Neisseria arctica TaxID=1470200 RepID=A0A0J0YPM0_9NEIS|nr:rod shape-determining protein MreD [Neisseria arctica]KLT72096.1 rod shape-determining protein MreD [Neisseria arctica]UOO85925.1 rod shape-determining protein MreD [Neisseria arctica]